MNPAFLTLDELLAIHSQQIADYGGSPGLRDIGLLQSALAMPMQMFGGVFVHGDALEMAAAYLFHVCKNHPLVDGNKRVALAAALIFLDLNDVAIEATEDEVVALTIGVADGSISKSAVAVFLAEHRRR